MYSSCVLLIRLLEQPRQRPQGCIRQDIPHMTGYQKGCRLHFHFSTPFKSPHASDLYRLSLSSARAAPKLTRARSSSRRSPAHSACHDVSSKQLHQGRLHKCSSRLYSHVQPTQFVSVCRQQSAAKGSTTASNGWCALLTQRSRQFVEALKVGDSLVQLALLVIQHTQLAASRRLATGCLHSRHSVPAGARLVS